MPVEPSDEGGGNGAGGGATPPTGDGKGGVELTEIGSFEAPLYVTQPTDAGDDIYVVEQGGTIQRVSPDGEASTFLDISDEVVSGGEQGLLSVAFPPDFSDSGLFYVDYTDTEGDTRVVEYKADGGDAADPDSARELLRIDQPFPNHNGGLLKFADDGLLYIGTGDGGDGGDPSRNGQSLDTLLGKILRIDPSPDGDLPYTIPPDNPFVEQGDARGEIYAYGLRNPWRYSFDRETGDLLIGDVGQDEQEEVDVVGAKQASGANFGWSAFEGDNAFNDDQADGADEVIDPALVATHDDGNCSITGGYAVRDERLESLYGRYLWADFCLGVLRSFTPEPGKQADDDTELGLDVDQVTSFGEDARGRIYATSGAGPVYRLDPAD